METKTTIKPIQGWVLIEPITEENQTVGGLVMPDSSQDVPMKGKTLAVGLPLLEGAVRDVASQLKKVGSVVLFKKYSGQTVKSEGKELKLVEFRDLLAVIEN